MKLKLLAATAALAIVAGAASAQTFSTANSQKCPPDNASVGVSVGVLNSVTTLRAVDVCPNQNVYVYAYASGTQQLNIETRTKDGSVVSLSTPTATTLTRALVFSASAGTTGGQQIRVSPSTAITGLNNISLTIVRTPAVVR